jgi:hypothetical protein
MKGPGGKAKHPVRRTWECPVCHRREWTGGQVVTRRCRCAATDDPAAQPWMQLVEEPEPQRKQPVAGAEAAATETSAPLPAPPAEPT